MANWLTRLRSAWYRHRPAEFFRLAVYNVVLYARNRGADRSSEPNSVDEKYGTDTGGLHEIGSLDVIGATGAGSATRYEPSGRGMVQVALDRLAIDYRDYSFIDFGSGKGRVLLVAAEYPFKSVIGVEFSRELHETAERNIALLPAEAVRAGSLKAVHGDAAAFELPRDNLVCYFYNPFRPPVITEVARRLAAHSDDHGYRVVVIYAEPRYRAAFADTGKFVVVDERPDVLTMTTRPTDGDNVAAAP